MKRTGFWERFFRFVRNFFGVEMFRAIMDADDRFFGACAYEEDDLSDSEFQVTEHFVIRFPERENPSVRFFPEGGNKISA